MPEAANLSARGGNPVCPSLQLCVPEPGALCTRRSSRRWPPPSRPPRPSRSTASPTCALTRSTSHALHVESALLGAPRLATPAS
eukprot:scaffold54843_cov67-Phaeocystis_antarctica.AAC.7